jgi:hypothetical protein
MNCLVEHMESLVHICQQQRSRFEPLLGESRQSHAAARRGGFGHGREQGVARRKRCLGGASASQLAYVVSGVHGYRAVPQQAVVSRCRVPVPAPSAFDHACKAGCAAVHLQEMLGGLE